MSYERQCPQHRQHLNESAGGWNASSLYCEAGESGHLVTAWLVVRVEDQQIVGRASMTGGHLLRGMFEQVILPETDTPPDRPCRNGHVNSWRMNLGRGLWHCVECKRLSTKKRQQTKEMT